MQRKASVPPLLNLAGLLAKLHTSTCFQTSQNGTEHDHPHNFSFKVFLFLSSGYFDCSWSCLSDRPFVHLKYLVCRRTLLGLHGECALKTLQVHRWLVYTCSEGCSPVSVASNHQSTCFNWFYSTSYLPPPKIKDWWLNTWLNSQCLFQCSFAILNIAGCLLTILIFNMLRKLSFVSYMGVIVFWEKDRMFWRLNVSWYRKWQDCLALKKKFKRGTHLPSLVPWLTLR